jgi:hypothetical protein
MTVQRITWRRAPNPDRILGDNRIGGGKKMAKIPQFKTEAELQQFWSTHDSADFWDDMVDDEVEISLTPQKGMLVMPLSENILRDVRELALRKGISSVQLLQKWIVAGLHQESNPT